MSVIFVEAPTTVRATFNYLKRSDKKPYSYTFEPPPGVPARSGIEDSVPDIVVRDARALTNGLSLDVQGFALQRHKSAVTDFYDEQQIRSVYYPEVEKLLLKVTGAEKIGIFDHTIRSVPKLREGASGYREPVRRVHNDYTATSGRRRVTDHLSPREAEQRLQHRFAEINVWRPIRGPVEEAPLAVCDARTIDPDDLIASDLIYPDKVGEIYNFSYNRAHRWYYFPRMTADEALLIKCFDSETDGVARFTAHSAFDDPNTPENPIPRESIEVRALVFFRPD
jgi:hypothetical protein